MARRIVRRGILLEQNKEPALSRPLRALFKEELPRKRLALAPPGQPSFLAPHEIVAYAREAAIVDESDGRALWQKMSDALRDGVRELVVDAIDDEPYISSQLGPMLHLPGDLAEGTELMLRAVGAAKARIEVYDQILDTKMKIPGRVGDVPILRVGGRYPAEYQWGKRRYGKHALSVGACALIHLWRAVYDGLAHTTTFVTVAGNCTSNPGNYEVPMGVSVAQVIEATGLIEEPGRVIVGGSMTGIGITDPKSVRVAAGIRGILLFAENYRDHPGVCIGCGRCTDSCPEGLSPYHIYRVLSARGRGDLSFYHVDRCVGCGTCSYVCPAKINLSTLIAVAKSRGSAEKRNML